MSRALLDLPEMIRDATQLSRSRGESLLSAAKAKAGKTGVETAVAKCKPAMIGDAAAQQARYLDLAVVCLEAENPTTRAIAEAVIFESGRPTILLPSARFGGKLDHVAIAWDGSRVAARAVADARLVLDRATTVTVLTVTDEKPLREERAGERLAARLQAAGLKASFKAIEAEDCPIAQTLQQGALDCGADMLVMGGYGHSRLRDFVLGGATDGVLSDLKLPVLLSH
jgi:nucleotide-binding universal stress UspA family protein